MVLDHELRVAYAARSRRTDPMLLERFCTSFGYEPMVFDAVDSNGVPVYHTNVLMCITSRFALVAAEMISGSARREEVIERLRRRGRRVVIGLSEAQIQGFAGNALELESESGEPLLAMSAQASAVLLENQKATIERTHRLVVLDIPTIELGGGSVRCMLAGVHLDSRFASESGQPAPVPQSEAC